MTSELRVDNLKGSTTGGSINVLSEGTSVTTNLQQGLTKAWVHYDQDGTHDIDDSFNVTSVVDNAVGRTGKALTNNMSNATYPTPFSGWDQTSFMTVSQGYDKTTSGWSNAHSGGDFSTAVDASQKGESALGDLA